MAGSSQEKSPQESSLLEQMNSLAPHGTSRSFRYEFEGLRDRIRKGESTGSQISDYAYLIYYDKEERDKIIERIREFQEKIGAHVGEEVIFYYPKEGIDAENKHLYGTIDNPELEARRNISGWNRRLKLFVLTGGLHVRRRGGGRFEYYGGGRSDRSKPVSSIVPEDLEYLSFTKAEIFVGTEEIEGWKKKPGNEEVYQELTQALKENSSSLV